MLGPTLVETRHHVAQLKLRVGVNWHDSGDAFGCPSVLQRLRRGVPGPLVHFGFRFHVFSPEQQFGVAMTLPENERLVAGGVAGEIGGTTGETISWCDPRILT